MSVSKECRLCLNEVEKLCNSHIIPETLYEKVYNPNHKMLSVSSDFCVPLKVEQKGYREYLLCSNCETKLSKWERVVKKDLIDMSKLQSNFLRITKVENWSFVENVKYLDFKRCMLSIIWRMSISSLQPFQKVNLGPHEEKIRVLLDSDDPLPTLTYPIMVCRLEMNGAHQPDIVALMDESRIMNRRVTSFIAYGFLIDIIISKQQMPNSTSILMLQHEGMLPVKTVDFMSLPQNINLSKRFEDPKAVQFYAKNT